MQAASTYIFNQRQAETKRSWPYNKARLCAMARQQKYQLSQAADESFRVVRVLKLEYVSFKFEIVFK